MMLRAAFSTLAVLVVVVSLQSTTCSCALLFNATSQWHIHRVVVYESVAEVHAFANISLPIGATSSVTFFQTTGYDRHSLHVECDSPDIHIDSVTFEESAPSQQSDQHLKHLTQKKANLTQEREAEEELLNRLRMRSQRLTALAEKTVSKGSDVKSDPESIFSTLATIDTGLSELATLIWASKRRSDELAVSIAEVDGKIRMESGSTPTVKVIITNHLPSRREKKDKDDEEEERKNYSLHFSFLQNASWRPSYDVKLDTASSSLLLEYSAVIRQKNLAWSDVSVELSTGSPARAKFRPPLEPWFLNPRRPVVVQPFASSQAAVNEMAGGRRSGAVPLSTATSFGSDGAMPKHKQSSTEAFVFEEAEEDTEQQHQVPHVNVRSSSISEVFVLPGLHSVGADGKVRVRIASLQFKTNLSFVALPRQVKEVFLRAEIRNDSPYSLLSGECSVFADGTFVSKTNMPLLPIGAATSLELGHDPALVATNMLLSRDEEETNFLFTSQRKKTTLRYALTIENRKSRSVEVYVQHPIPQLRQRWHGDGHPKKTLDSSSSSSGNRKEIQLVMLEPPLDLEKLMMQGLAGDHTQPIRENVNLSISGKYLEWRVTVGEGSKVRIPLAFSVEAPADVDLAQDEL